MIPGRNDPCPCGSGKKYKKCCIPKYDKPVAVPRFTPMDSITGSHSFSEFMANMWQPKDLEQMSDEAIVNKLQELGIPVDKDEFVQDLQEQMSSDLVLELWQQRYDYQVEGKDEDFPMLAAQQLSQRWAPDLYSMDKLEELAGTIERSDTQLSDKGLDQMRLIWDRLKALYIRPVGIRSFEDLHEKYRTFADFGWVMDEYSAELHNASIGAEPAERQSFMEERIRICQEQLGLLPDEEPHSRLYLRRDIAESYGRMGDFKLAEQAFEELIDEHPNWVWSYIAWARLYEDRAADGDLESAEKLYRRGMANCREDANILQERLHDLLNK